jgi:hypothetical protein
MLSIPRRIETELAHCREREIFDFGAVVRVHRGDLLGQIQVAERHVPRLVHVGFVTLIVKSGRPSDLPSSPLP